MFYRYDIVVYGKQSGTLFYIVFGILSGPGVLLLARFFRHKSYVSVSKYSYNGVCGFSLLSMTYPSISCHGYCLTPHVQFGGCSGWKWHVGTVGLLLIDCCAYISLAMSSGLVRMLLFMSKMQSNGGISWFLKTILFIYLGFFRIIVCILIRPF